MPIDFDCSSRADPLQLPQQHESPQILSQKSMMPLKRLIYRCYDKCYGGAASCKAICSCRSTPDESTWPSSHAVTTYHAAGAKGGAKGGKAKAPAAAAAASEDEYSPDSSDSSSSDDESSSGSGSGSSGDSSSDDADDVIDDLAVGL